MAFVRSPFLEDPKEELKQSHYLSGQACLLLELEDIVLWSHMRDLDEASYGL